MRPHKGDRAFRCLGLMVRRRGLNRSDFSERGRLCRGGRYRPVTTNPRNRGRSAYRALTEEAALTPPPVITPALSLNGGVHAVSPACLVRQAIHQPFIGFPVHATAVAGGRTVDHEPRPVILEQVA